MIYDLWIQLFVHLGFTGISGHCNGLWLTQISFNKIIIFTYNIPVPRFATPFNIPLAPCPPVVKQSILSALVLGDWFHLLLRSKQPFKHQRDNVG